MEALAVDLRKTTQREAEEGMKRNLLLYELNQSAPNDAKRGELLQQLFGSFGQSSYLITPVHGVCFDHVHIGEGVSINANCLMMARGGLSIEDKAQIAANVQLITNNHDPYIREILLCKPILIKEGAWIGAGATILPGVTVGKYAIVGAMSLVNKDVPDYGLVAGNPARIIRTLDPEKFDQQDGQE